MMSAIRKTLFGITLIWCSHSVVYAQSQVPVFRTRQDSADYFTTQKLISELFARKPEDRASTNIDSLMQLQMKRRQTSMIGYAYVYQRSDGYTSLDDLVNQRTRPAQVTRLSIENIGDGELPDVVLKCVGLESVEFVNTHLTRLPRELRKLKKLTQVRVLNNRSQSQFRLSRNKHITFLTIRSNEPGKLPSRYNKLRRLDSLDLSRNLMSQFPNIPRRLKRLSVSENDLTLEDLRIRGTKKLEVLAMRHNKVRVLPGEFRKLPKLRKLNLQYNLIEDVGEGIAALQKLEELSLYENKLRFIPEVIFSLKALREIDLYYNQVERIPDNITQLVNLKILYLSNNKLTSLPESLGNMQSLRELYVHHNKLSYLPESIANLKQLQVLRFNNNEFVSFPKSILELPNLERLDLSYNGFQKLPESFTGYQHLKILVLAANPWEDNDSIVEVARGYRSRGTIVHLNTLNQVIEDN